MNNTISNPVRFLLCILLLVLGSVQILHAQSNNNMGIGTTDPDASAILDITSNSKGLLIPRLTDGQQGGLSGPAGLLIYNTTQNRFNYYNGGWQGLNLWRANGNKTYYNDGFVGIGISDPLTRLSISASTTEAKITLWDGGSGTNHYGFGVSGGQLNYHVNSSSDSHVFYSGGKNGNGTEIMRIYGNGFTRTTGGSVLNYDNPTVYLQDTNGKSGMLHQNGDLMHFLSAGVNSTTWAINGSYWPLTLNMTTDAATFGGPAYFMEGDVGIGTNNPAGFKLAVIHGTSWGMKIQNTSAGSDYWELWQSSTSAGDLNLYAGANYVGNFNYSSGTYSPTSDRRLKDNITPLQNVLPSILELAAKSYTYKSDAKKVVKIGFIAQDVEKLFPELVTPPSISERGETPYTMDYSGFGVIAVKAIQEQQVIIETQAAKIEAQQAEIDAIKKALEKAGIKLD